MASTDTPAMRLKVQWRAATFSWVAYCPRCDLAVWTLTYEDPSVPEGTPRGPLPIGDQIPSHVEVDHLCEDLRLKTEEAVERLTGPDEGAMCKAAAATYAKHLSQVTDRDWEVERCSADDGILHITLSGSLRPKPLHEVFAEEDVDAR